MIAFWECILGTNSETHFGDEPPFYNYCRVRATRMLPSFYTKDGLPAEESCRSVNPILHFESFVYQTSPVSSIDGIDPVLHKHSVNYIGKSLNNAKQFLQINYVQSPKLRDPAKN